MKKTKEIVLPLGIGQRPKRRPARIADMIREELALLLLTGIKDPRLANVTVTRVSMTADLKQAVIYYSVIGGAKQAKDAVIGWSRAKGFIRSRLAAKLQLRYAPQPVFKRDLDMEKHAEIERVLAEIKEEDNEPSLDRIAATLRDARRVLLVTHIHPDGDALGSQLGLGFILESMGKEVYLYAESEISHLYDFLPGGDKLRIELPHTGQFDCAVALDCGDCFRLGLKRETLLTATPFLVIDHHAGHQDFGGERWVDAKRASTGEMVYDLAMALGAELSYEAAYCLYTAIVSDTGSFKYSSTTSETFRVAGALLEKGVKPSDVAGKLFDNFSVNRLRLLTDVLETLTLHADDRLALITVSQEMLARTGTEMADTETFINYPRSLHTVNVAVFIKEGPEGMVSVSMRSKGTAHDVAVLAAKFGGGGHRNAAGCKLAESTVEAVREQLLPELLAMVGTAG